MANRPLPASPTQTVEAERAVVEEVADVSGLRRHGAEGVGAAGGEGVDADEQHVDQKGPGVAVAQEVQRGAEHAEAPQEVPANNFGELQGSVQKGSDRAAVGGGLLPGHVQGL